MNKRHELKTLPAILEGGLYDGETRDFDTRQIAKLSLGVFRLPHWMIVEHYDRTIFVDRQTGRTIFRYTGTTEANFPQQPKPWLMRLLIWLGLHQPQVNVYE
jgi:hypothetical protein